MEVCGLDRREFMAHHRRPNYVRDAAPQLNYVTVFGWQRRRFDLDARRNGWEKLNEIMVGVAGFEPATPACRTQCLCVKRLILLATAGASSRFVHVKIAYFVAISLRHSRYLVEISLRPLQVHDGRSPGDNSIARPHHSGRHDGAAAERSRFCCRSQNFDAARSRTRPIPRDRCTRYRRPGNGPPRQRRNTNDRRGACPGAGARPASWATSARLMGVTKGQIIGSIEPTWRGFAGKNKRPGTPVPESRADAAAQHVREAGAR